ncbi:MAG TPA: M48 family metalloprotease [Burkholderiaceae bacterium]|nr:M48 family metalloprotease [Burkholderiaceae bacterium]
MLFSLRSIVRALLRRGCAVSLVVALGVSPAPVALSQINLPNLGDAESEVLSPANERKLGEQVMRELRNAGEIFEDAELTEYLTNLGLELTAASASVSGGGSAVAATDFTFFPVLDTTVNAFALPGGFIGVHTGLIALAQTESELASVLAHEIAHVTQRHIARRFADQKTSTLAIFGALLLAIVAARSGGSSSGDAAQAALAIGQAGAIQQQLNYSRDAEREADRIGFQTLVKAGYEPQAMPDFFQRLQNASRIQDSNAYPYLRTHPLGVERIADTQNRVRQERYRQHADGIDFHLIRARVRALRDTSVAGLREAKTDFESQLAVNANARGARAAAAYYGLAIVQLGQRDLDGATRSINEARKRGEAHPFIEKLAAQVQVERKDLGGAVATMDAARQKWPASRTLRVAYAQTLQVANAHAQAIGYLREQVSLYRSDAKLFELLARSYSATNQPAREHQAIAEVYQLRGGTRAAVDQLEIARRYARTGSSNDDLILGSEIEARLRELRAQLLEELKDSQRGRG